MKRITPWRLIVCISALWVATPACHRAAPSPAETRPLTSASQPRVYVPTEHDLRAAQATMQAIAAAAKRYFISEQRMTEHEPWHPLKHLDNKDLPVPWDAYTFPGGPGFTMISHATMPRSGEGRLIQTQSSHDWLEHVRYHLGEAWPQGTSRFRYSYIVGPDSADNAALTIIAEANFDPSTPTSFAMKIMLWVDPETAEIATSPIEVINARP